MDYYILNSLYQRIQVVENYESIIWTERYADIGDITITMASTLENRNKFSAGTLIGKSDSARVMVIETFEDSEDASGQQILRLTGRSLEKILSDRVAAKTDGTTWLLTGLPAAIARQIYHDICVTGTFNTGDIIPGVTEGTFFPEDTLPEPPDEITYSVDVTSVYQATKSLCDPFGMGFRLVKDGDTSQLYYDIYVGSDRTSQQTDYPAVVFSEDLETLQSPTELTSIALYKNVAYVFSPAGSTIVYALDVDPTVAGFDRQALWVKVDDIAEDEDPDVALAKMIQKGTEELYKSRRFSAFDGELNPYNAYEYGVLYNVGDLVEMQNRSGVRNQMQVTEQISISDAQGERSYPTLSLRTFVSVGSWLARPHDQHWDDVPGTEHWNDLP